MFKVYDVATAELDAKCQWLITANDACGRYASKKVVTSDDQFFVCQMHIRKVEELFQALIQDKHKKQ